MFIKKITKEFIFYFKEEECSTSSSVTADNKSDNNVQEIKENIESTEKIIDTVATNDTTSSSLQQSTGDEKLASEYEQFMKMVCTDGTVRASLSPAGDTADDYSAKTPANKFASPRSYHEFSIDSNSVDDKVISEVESNEKFEKKSTLHSAEDSIKSIEGDESTISTNYEAQISESNTEAEHPNNNNNESNDSRSIPSDWEKVKIKDERISDENTESKEEKKRKRRRKVSSSSDSSSSTSSSNSEEEKRRKKRKRKIQINSSSSDSDSSDSSSSSSSSSTSTDEKRKRKRKKKKMAKKRKKTKRMKARTKKKRRRKMSTDSSSSDSDRRRKRKRKKKKKRKEVKLDAKSINNGDMSKIISPSPSVIASSADETKLLHSIKIKEEIDEDKRSDEVVSTRKTDMSVHDNEYVRGEKKESKSDKNFVEQWEDNSTQNDGDTSSQDHSVELTKISGSEIDKHRKKRKHSDSVELDKDKSNINEERIHGEKERSDQEIEVKRKKKRDKNRSNTEFLADWERETERITQQNEASFLKKSNKSKEKWGETEFDTLNVPSLTQLEKEVCNKQLLADDWEVDSLEAVSDLILSKRKSSTSRKIEKEVRYDKKTDTYIAIEKESAREIKKKQERSFTLRIWEQEQEEGEREEMMLMEERNKRKKDEWDIESESFLRKNKEEVDVNDIIRPDKKWDKSDEDSAKEDPSKITKLDNSAKKLESLVGSKRVRKSRWDMNSQSEEKSEIRDIWEEYVEKEESHTADYSEGFAKTDLIDFYQKNSHSRESLERPWTLEEIATKPVQVKQIEDASIKNLIPAKVNEEQIIKKEHQTRDQFDELLGLDAKFKKKPMELYSPSSPALSQKSQVNAFIFVHGKNGNEIYSSYK